MRKALDALYGGALVGACLSMVLIAVLVFVQVAARLLDRLLVLLGMPRTGFIIPSLAEIGGFLLVAAAFLALARTLRAAGHVRVTLALRWFGEGADRVMTGFALLVGIGLTGFAAWAILMQTLATYRNGSVSFGIIPMPLWVPQAVMTAGIVIFLIALLDEMFQLLRGGEPSFRHQERTREVTEGGH
ncbi:TRAP transporter small permease [Aerobium aerolatum]|uniref:TRAP transporter small permease protein n=1 Tax=Aquamicrobium aerolatum DSM 21857 TaxID=1121003 RepID=A0A1I3MJH5_9HYPH|nr:TRAP transporter small permease subunit [Aquamicrobium aerolatum]SFI97168.1 TRAP-type C4-dicarboxylate transport system, small permease component [Aquamicrobium aerolatum DSM 21857]